LVDGVQEAQLAYYEPAGLNQEYALTRERLLK
jgi:hypothetical protein